MAVAIMKDVDPERDVKKILEMIKFKPKKKVFIKPNLCAPVKADTGIITDPEIVRLVIHFLKDHGVKEITIGEDTWPGKDTKKCFEATGYSKLAKEEKVKLIDLEYADKTMVKWKYGRLAIPSIVLRKDVTYINIPKIKTHNQTIATISIKNQKGLLLANDKKNFHSKFKLHDPLAQLAKIVKPDMILVDGIIGLEGDGPGGLGEAVKLNLLVAGYNHVEVDATCCRIMGIDPKEVEHIKKSSALKLGTLNPKIIGENIDNVKRNFKRAQLHYIKKLNVHLHCPITACSSCHMSIAHMKVMLMKKPWHWHKLFFHGVLGRLDLVVGSDCKLPKKYGKVICIGNCAKNTAEKHNFPWVPGCPPKSENILKTLVGKKK